MNMDQAAVLAQPAAPGATSELFQQIGVITRQLHDTLAALGVMPRLQAAAEGLPDARSRLTYIAKKTGEAAEKVLNSVDQAKLEHRAISDATRRMADAMVENPVKAVASGAVMNFMRDVEASTGRIDGHLTDIMMAQDFHDLTGQVVAKVVKLTTELEDNLVKLLVQAAPQELHAAGAPAPVETGALNGPVVDPGASSNTVANQNEVDDLLASLGF